MNNSDKIFLIVFTIGFAIIVSCHLKVVLTNKKLSEKLLVCEQKINSEK